VQKQPYTSCADRTKHRLKDPVLVFVAEDVEATVQELASNGVTIVTKPGPAPYNPRKTVAMIEDSESNRIVISSR
jgi:predicted enzyme related to lactoylglutathione lyase